MPRADSSSKLRDNYTWHLRAPFEKSFDSRAWWLERDCPPVDPVAALYELARRLPLVGALRRKHLAAVWHGRELQPELTGRTREAMISEAFDHLGKEHSAIHCLCLIGLRAWPDLDLKSQEYWEMSVGKLKGVDCRDELGQCCALVGDSFNDLLLARLKKVSMPKGALRFHVEAKRGDGPRKIAADKPDLAATAADRILSDFRKTPPTAQEFEDLVAAKSREAFQAGDFVFALASDLTHERAVELFSAAYRAEQKTAGLETQRARWSDWLPAVAEFENDERRKAKSKSSVFTRYRRILDGIDFNPQQSRLMKFISPS